MIILSLITVDQSQISIFHMFQYHYLGPDYWVDAGCKFQDGPQTMHRCMIDRSGVGLLLEPTTLK